MNRKIPKLLSLLASNDASPQQIRVEASEEDATVYLYDIIDSYWGVNAKDFAKTLDGISAKTIHLRINSPGGDVFEARAMVAAIRACSAKTIAHIDGLAASAATYVALAANEVRMNDGAFMMIHNAWTFAYGNANELRVTADLLEKIDGSIVNDYVKKTGKSEDVVKAWMAAETWFDAAEAKAEGFVDAIEDGDTAASNQWNLKSFDNAPESLLNRTPKTKPEADHLRATAQRRMRLLDLSAA